MKRVIIIHGWEGFPEEGWFPWLKKELEGKGYSVQVPAMPNPEEPEIDAWVGKLEELVGKPDNETYLVGHSIGCQAILRYIEKLDEGEKLGGVLLVAGWVHLTPAALEDEGADEIAKPWLETPIDWEKVRPHCDNYTAIFSKDDPFVPVEDAEIFRKELGAEVVILEGLQHINGEAGVTELPSALDFFE